MSLNIETGVKPGPKRILIYGQEGVGKSTFMSKLPGVLFADTEEGTRHLNVHRVNIRTLSDLREVVAELLKGGHGYKVLALDTADRLWDLCAEAVLKENGWTHLEQLEYSRCYVPVTQKFDGILRAMDMLREAGISVIIACHCKVETQSPPDNPAYSMYQPKVSAPGRKAEVSKSKLVEWADSVFFCHFEARIDAKTKKAVPGECRRLVETVHTAQWEAKYRGNIIPAQFSMDDPSSLIRELALANGEGVVANGTARTNQPEPEPITPSPVEETPTRGAAAVPPSGSHPAELGFNKTSDPEPSVWSDEEYRWLVAYFVDRGCLQPGQTLADLPPNIATALKQRPKAALQKARDHEIAKSNARAVERGAA